MFKNIVIALLAGVIGGVSSGYFITTNMPFSSDSEALTSNVRSSLVASEINKKDPIFADIKNIYYSSNNGKRTRLIVMDFAVEVETAEHEKKVNVNAPIIKSRLLSLLASNKYKHVEDQNLLTFMTENLNEDIAPLFEGITAKSTPPVVHITRLIIQ